MDFTVQITGLDELTARLKNAPQIAAPILARAMSAAQATLAKYTVKGIVPWRSGFLTQSFRANLTANVLRWFPTASYAPYVEFGTKPHVITPTVKGALYWPGASHPVRSVNHPGTRPNPFMERILKAAQPDIDTVFKSALEKIVAGMAS